MNKYLEKFELDYKEANFLINSEESIKVTFNLFLRFYLIFNKKYKME